MPFVSIITELIDKSLFDVNALSFCCSFSCRDDLFILSCLDAVNSFSIAKRSALLLFLFNITTANPPPPAPHSERPLKKRKI